jgi:hypothetical protein
MTGESISPEVPSDDHRIPITCQWILGHCLLKRSAPGVYYGACVVAVGVAGKRANRIDSPQTRQGGPERGNAPRKENGSDE